LEGKENESKSGGNFSQLLEGTFVQRKGLIEKYGGNSLRLNITINQNGKWP
jgi:hypothetical protein